MILQEKGSWKLFYAKLPTDRLISWLCFWKPAQAVHPGVNPTAAIGQDLCAMSTSGSDNFNALFLIDRLVFFICSVLAETLWRRLIHSLPFEDDWETLNKPQLMQAGENHFLKRPISSPTECWNRANRASVSIREAPEFGQYLPEQQGWCLTQEPSVGKSLASYWCKSTTR